MNIIEMQPKFVTVKEAVKSTGMSEHLSEKISKAEKSLILWWVKNI